MDQTQIPTIKRQTPGIDGSKSGATTRQFYCEPDFYKMAATLRAQFQDQVRGARETSTGLTPFSYAFCENAYQFLTASAERVFAPEALEALIEGIRSWAGSTLGTRRVSTPQIRVFVSGCRRNLLRDDIAPPWRYSLSLTRAAGRRKIVRMTVVTEDLSGKTPEQMRIENVLSSNMEFNQWLVHETKSAYSIEVTAKSMNPLEGAVFLDGYLW